MTKNPYAWEKCKLGEVLALLKDGTHGTHKNVEADGVFLLSAKNIKDGKIYIDKNDRKISRQDFLDIHKTFSLQNGDVLLTIVGSIGEAAIIQHVENITFQRSVAYLRPKENLASQFLFTTITTSSFQNELVKRQVTSAQSGVYLGQLEKIEITLPTLPEQQKIGALFRRLDRLITLHK
ncbi:restriction endonuclease subunit S [Gallibacterium anatis]|uniref:restriction endonuclease subunit S n=1 Tax=Gallibacterium anatis TaxID=750 RepID=UPI00255141A4|nr:restriction endonuclease subunit S [Gallibacterium anatis]MDK9561530.1 restriction endonuclease subunit S [Gallibacterium anatis]